MGTDAVDRSKYFKIQVVDDETGRGVPLIHLTTLSSRIEYWTDSAGLIAFYEPGQMDREVYFRVDGHGYKFLKDKTGMRGVALVTTSGGSVTIKVRRINIAQRLYRITGPGIYHDSYLLGEPMPTKHPVMNAGVTGQDSTLVTKYDGKLFWVWGDSTCARHHDHWNYKVTSATTLLPEDGGLDPEVGVDLDYFEDGDFTKSMCPLPGKRLYWLGSLLPTKDSEGRERLIASYAEVYQGLDLIKDAPVPKDLCDENAPDVPIDTVPFKVVGRGYVMFNDEKQVFERTAEYPMESGLLPRAGTPFVHTENGVEYQYFVREIPSVRVPNNLDALNDIHAAESFTCLKEGAVFDNTAEQLDRDAEGKLRFSWKKGALPLSSQQQEQLMNAGHIKAEEKLFSLLDVATGQPVRIHGAIHYNPYRKRWISIRNEVGGTSYLGELWYCEADHYLGPWVYAQKIVTHDNYSCYNICQHPLFAKDGGRKVFFEGTYTYTFTHPTNPKPTPRYDYNQIMYMLELNDPRLFLPVPVYACEGGSLKYCTANDVPEGTTSRQRVFFAPDRPRAGTIPVHERRDLQTGVAILTTIPYDVSTGKPARVAFFGIPNGAGDPPAATVALYEYVHRETGERVYLPKESMGDINYARTQEPICRVWRNPISFDPFADL